MDGSIIVFSLRKDLSSSEKTGFCLGFYGDDTSTWKGKYKYHRHGLLDDIPYRKIAKSVIIIRSSDLEKVKDYVRDRTEEFHVRTLKEKDPIMKTQRN